MSSNNVIISNRDFLQFFTYDNRDYSVYVKDNNVLVSKVGDTKNILEDEKELKDITDIGLLQYVCENLAKDLRHCQNFIKEQTGYFQQSVGDNNG